MKKITFALMVTLSMASVSWGQLATKRVLLEDQTDVGCGYCPRGKTYTQQIVSSYPAIAGVHKVIGVANHVVAIGPDSMANSYSLTIDSMNGYGYPGGMVDRVKYSDQSNVVFATNNWQSKCVSELNLTTPFAVDITSTFNSTTRVVTPTVTVTVLSSYTAPSGSSLRINCILVEDSVTGTGVYWDQHNYMGNGCAAPDNTSPWYSFPCSIVGYAHDGVARMSLDPSPWGTNGILPASPIVGHPYAVSYTSSALPARWKTNSMKIVAFVTLFNANPNSRPVLNANELDGLSGTAPTDIPGISFVSDLNVFPNPASNIVTIEGNLNTSSEVNLSIVNIIGQTVFEKEYKPSSNFSEHIPLTNMNSGLYFVRISNGAESVTRKLTINK